MRREIRGAASPGSGVLESVHNLSQGTHGLVDRALVAISPGDREDFPLVQSLIDQRSEVRPGPGIPVSIALPEERLFLRRGPPVQQEKGPIRTEPKTKAGKRKIDLPLFLVVILQEHRSKQEEWRVRQGDKWEDMGLVFPDLRGGYFNPNYLLRVFKRFFVLLA